ncbi:hypothetical protein BH10BAC5_BH10BAC5_17240 [soil metagenome]
MKKQPIESAIVRQIYADMEAKGIKAYKLSIDLGIPDGFLSMAKKRVGAFGGALTLYRIATYLGYPVTRYLKTDKEGNKLSGKNEPETEELHTISILHKKNLELETENADLKKKISQFTDLQEKLKKLKL